MAYPTVDKPYGFQPVNLIGGQVYAGSTRLMRIVSGYATSIYYGDVVKMASDGTIQKDVGTSTATPVGIFVGCTYTNPTTSQKTFAQYYPANTAANDIQAYVVDDPDILFKVATCSNTTVVFVSSQVVGENAVISQNTGSNNTGDSANGLYGANTATTASFPVRIVDIVPDTSNGSNGFCELICKFNAPYMVSTFTSPGNTVATVVTGGHAYLNPTGV